MEGDGFFIQALVGGPVPLEPVVLAQRLEEPKSSSKFWQRGVGAHAHTFLRGYEKREGRGGRDGGRGKAVQMRQI